MRFDSMDMKFINCARRKSAEVCVALRKSIDGHFPDPFQAEVIIFPMHIPLLERTEGLWTRPHAKENFGWRHTTVRIAGSEQSMTVTPSLSWAGFGDGTPTGALDGKHT